MKSDKMITGKIYKVIKSGDDGTVRYGDLVAISSDGKLYKGLSSDGSQSAWIDKDDLTSKIMSFDIDEINTQ